jgi:hypothetical protein
MDKITVDKSDLLDTLRSNRASHFREFEKAQETYGLALIAGAEKRLTAIKDAYRSDAPFADLVKLNSAVPLPVPEEHTDDFDTAILMLTWSKSDEVELDQHEFSQYVENKWRWAPTFAANTLSYNGLR